MAEEEREETRESEGGPRGGGRRAQGGGGGRGGGRWPRGGGGRGGRRGRACPFCEQKVREIDYKKADELRRYLTERGKIKPRRKNATCAKHQRRLSVAVKRARHLALLPFAVETARGS